MPSYTIPEEIIGIPLFVPAANDFFSIETGGLPNGEDCLVIHGDVNRDYKAFQAAQTLSPNVFLSRSAIHSQVFWLKAPVTAVSSINASEHSMLCLQDAMEGQTNPNFSNSAWHIGAISGGTGRITYKTGGTLTIDNARTGGWKMLTITNNGTNITAYLDAVEAAVSGPAGIGSAVTPVNSFLCIGSYTDQGTLNGYEHEWRLGKWSFIDHVLNVTERAILYNAMMVSMSVTINKGSSQADPATGSTVTFDVVFSKAVTGFGIADVTLSGTAGATTVGVSGTGATYIVTVSGMTTPGTVIANIPASVATAADGSTNMPSTSTDNSVAWS